jgi:hypothetical protein
MKVSGKLRWAYLSEEQAKQKGMQPEQYNKLKKVLTKTENIFYTAGGKKENLKNAILTGKGNQDHQVLAGLGDAPLDEMDETVPLPILLGEMLYRDENSESDGLGVITMAAITAASGTLAVIAANIKKIGDLFPKGNKLNDAGQDEGDPKKDLNEVQDESEMDSDTSSDKNSTSDNNNSGNNLPAPTDNQNSRTPAPTQDAPTTDPPPDNNGTNNKPGFWDKNKTWLKPTLWGAGGLTALGLAAKALFGKKEKTKTVSGLNGTSNKNKKKLTASKEKKKSVALM